MDNSTVLLTAMFIATFLSFAIVDSANAQQQDGYQQADPTDAVLVIHGGAGTIEREQMTDEMERDYRSALEEALQAGYAVLQEGGESEEAVVAAIALMEESPLFNAGVGAVFTNERTVEHDASIMRGDDLNAGASSGTKTVRSPIALARAVMHQSPHVMLSGEGAETFAQNQELEQVDNEFFYTERRLEQINEVLEEEAREESGPTSHLSTEFDPALMGTVGAVALDNAGNLAAGTSTGGMTNKQFGRIGDSPIIGAGTYADNETAGVSSTGHGEYFIRSAVAHDITARMRYQGLSLEEASDQVIHERILDLGGYGGVVALDADGNVAMPFNTPGMYRGFVDADGNIDVRIYEDEDN